MSLPLSIKGRVHRLFDLNFFLRLLLLISIEKEIIMARLSKTAIILIGSSIAILVGVVLYLALYERKKKQGFHGGGIPVIKPGNFAHPQPRLVMYYADWCPHCTNAKPEWSKVKHALGSSGIAVEEVDCTAGDAMQQHGISSVPTVRFYPQGANGPFVAHQGHKTAESILAMVDPNNRQRE